MVIKPVGVAHLHKAGRRVAHKQQLPIAEAVLEVGEKGSLPASDVVGIVHKAACLRLVGQWNPTTAQRLLPRMCQVESVPHFVAGGPEDHAPHPRLGIGITGRRILDERIVEDGRPLAMVGPDIVEHDAAQAGSHLVQGSEEHPHSPLRLGCKA